MNNVEDREDMGYDTIKFWKHESHNKNRYQQIIFCDTYLLLKYTLSTEVTQKKRRQRMNKNPVSRNTTMKQVLMLFWSDENPKNHWAGVVVKDEKK